MNHARVSQLLAAFPTKHLLVIGDLMLDEFLWGKVSRISPEAPVPVVEVVKEEWFPGGAGDTVIAIFTLALSAGATTAEAAELANHASGIVVGKLGTTTVTPGELLASFEP